MNDEQLDELLLTADETAANRRAPAGLASRVREAHQERQSQRQRLKRRTAFVACYIAGMLTTWLLILTLSPSRDSKQEKSVQAPRSPELVKTREPARNPKTQSDGETKDTLSPLSQYELYRELGDESHQKGNYRTAVAHYRKAIAAATKDELRISYTQDSWLLISLKKSRSPKNKDAGKGTSI